MTNRQKQTKTLEFLGHPSTGFDPKIEAAIQDICMWLLHSRSEPCNHSWKMLALKIHKTLTHFCKKRKTRSISSFLAYFVYFRRVWSRMNQVKKKNNFSNCFMSLPSWRPPSRTGSSLSSSLKLQTVERFPVFKIFDKLPQDTPSGEISSDS